MNNGTYNKNFLLTRETLRSKLTSKPLGTKKLEKAEVIKIPKEKDEIEIKDRSPLIYNRHKLVSINAKKIAPTDKKVERNESEFAIKEKTREDLIIVDQMNMKLLEKERQNVRKLEMEINLFKSKMSDQEKVIKEQNTKIKDLENQNSSLSTENNKIKEKYDRLKTKVKTSRENRNVPNSNSEMNDYPGDDLILPVNGFGNIDRLNRIAEMISNMREFMYPHEADNDYMDQIYPDPDNMTYEQLLELQERIGFVNKGLSPEEINKIPSVYFSKTNIYKRNFSDTCTICQFEFNDREYLRQLNCAHCYHTNCIEEWLKDNKACPMCKEEVKF